MIQSKVESFIETMTGTLVGFIVSMMVWEWIIVPVYHIESTIAQNFEITLIYTVASIIRSYYWRRLFANRVHAKIHTWIKGLKYESK